MEELLGKFDWTFPKLVHIKKHPRDDGWALTRKMHSYLITARHDRHILWPYLGIYWMLSQNVMNGDAICCMPVLPGIVIGSLYQEVSEGLEVIIGRILGILAHFNDRLVRRKKRPEFNWMLDRESPLPTLCYRNILIQSIAIKWIRSGMCTLYGRDCLPTRLILLANEKRTEYGPRILTFRLI